MERYNYQPAQPLYMPPPLSTEAALHYLSNGDSLHTLPMLLRIAQPLRPETTEQEIRADKHFMDWCNAIDAFERYNVGVDRDGQGSGMWMVHLGAFLCLKLRLHPAKTWPMHRAMGEEYADTLSMHFFGTPLALKHRSARVSYHPDYWFS